MAENRPEDRKVPSTAGANAVDAFVREVGKLPVDRAPGVRADTVNGDLSPPIRFLSRSRAT